MFCDSGTLGVVSCAICDRKIERPAFNAIRFSGKDVCPRCAYNVYRYFEAKGHQFGCQRCGEAGGLKRHADVVLCDECAAAEPFRPFRESGGSIPGECPCGEGKNPLHALLKSHEPPVLNKSGGSRVKGE